MKRVIMFEELTLIYSLISDSETFSSRINCRIRSLSRSFGIGSLTGGSVTFGFSTNLRFYKFKLRKIMFV